MPDATPGEDEELEGHDDDVAMPDATPEAEAVGEDEGGGQGGRDEEGVSGGDETQCTKQRGF